LLGLCGAALPSTTLENPSNARTATELMSNLEESMLGPERE
jgi:hypothetical protein